MQMHATTGKTLESGADGKVQGAKINSLQDDDENAFVVVCGQASMLLLSVITSSRFHSFDLKMIFEFGILK